MLCEKCGGELVCPQCARIKENMEDLKYLVNEIADKFEELPEHLKDKLRKEIRGLMPKED